MSAPSRNDIAKLIWDTSRADEGTISATGANIIADALIDKFIIVNREEIETLIERVKKEVLHHVPRNP